MDVFYWIVDLLIPLTMIGVGLLFRRWIPRNTNYVIGYRTRRSMSSQDAWEYANRRFAEIWLRMGFVLVALIVPAKLLLQVNRDHLTLAVNGLGIAAMVLSIPIVEKELRQRFGR